ncbi:MAG: tRNA 4-thiouridine(8) synthase ThiI [Firmicutes bacterium]|nr:tRNA 4-thiouridine(8) synthase ThiI [Bacillota bacterium]
MNSRWERLVLVRYGELALKGKNRPFFERELKRRVKDVVVARGPAGTAIRETHGRLYLELPAGTTRQEAVNLAGGLQKVFGIVGAGPAVRTPLDEGEVMQAALEVVREHLALDFPGRSGESGTKGGAGGDVQGGTEGAHARPLKPVTFKVRAHRTEKRFPLDSLELNRRIGAHLLERIPGLAVDVHRPELVLSIEVRKEGIYLYSLDLPGPGGLPTGTGGRVALLLSGGIDSPVAGWMMMKRGLRLSAIHFHSYPFTSERSREKVEDLCRVLAQWGGSVDLHIVSFTEVQKEIRLKAPEELTITLMRRMMLRISERIALAAGIPALVTGESLGQVASQTLESLVAIQEAASVPVLRPLIGLDKTEITAIARRIGTFEISNRPYEDCCTIFVPRHPRTRPTVEEAHAAETVLEFEGLLDEAVRSAERVEFKA